MNIWPFCFSNNELCYYTPTAVLLVLVTAVILFSLFLYKNKEKNDMPAQNPVDNLAERWLKDHKLTDDSFGSLIGEYCGLYRPVPIGITNINFANEEVTLSLTFPNTNITRVVTLKNRRLTYIFDESLGNEVMGDFYFEEDFFDDSPSYDEDGQIPLQGVRWDYIVSKIYGAEIHISQNKYNQLFPKL